ncbi:ATP-binding cassette domain-containing protein [Clostridium bowmanii]|uniref:ATP-binding cassette domain-containing protein n=1 Tax=Clostridium bowmanii TaxID=132925 RepID=UPI001C0B613D|nr:ATP-binding cassette domain-containing protein [Clostridium bowmanii]MBU3190806.1 ATP-binding cassette domain-containing protein [Clostridium bowmanii]MCA1075290.1 ATP-binding cassette domain-containing protein [Clostridium bowmanii]
MNIKLIDVCKEYNGKEVLNIDELNFKEGYVYALLGLNGSEKTTLLQCVSGLEDFIRGTVLYDNKAFGEFVKSDISVMLQSPYLFNSSVIDNIIMGLKFRKFDKEAIEERISLYVNCFEIDDLLNKNTRELSGGEQAKVSLLRTAILETKMTFLDEPTASMDIESTLRAEKLIKAMAKGKRSVILVTHDFLQAERVADFVIFLDKGRIIEQGEKNKVLKFPEHKLLRQILKRGDEHDKNSNIDHE